MWWCLPRVPGHCASSVGAAPPLTDDQVVNHWSKQINSQHVHLLATLSVSPSVCVCAYPVRSHQRSPSAHTRWLPSASCRLTRSTAPCVGECCMYACDWWEWPLNVTFRQCVSSSVSALGVFVEMSQHEGRAKRKKNKKPLGNVFAKPTRGRMWAAAEVPAASEGRWSDNKVATRNWLFWDATDMTAGCETVRSLYARFALSVQTWKCGALVCASDTSWQVPFHTFHTHWALCVCALKSWHSWQSLHMNSYLAVEVGTVLTPSCSHTECEKKKKKTYLELTLQTVVLHLAAHPKIAFMKCFGKCTVKVIMAFKKKLQGLY